MNSHMKRHLQGTPTKSNAQMPSTSQIPIKPKSTEQKPNQCCVCQEVFFDQELLQIHEESHITESPFKCRYCASVFSLLKHFKIHVSRHMNTNGGSQQNSQKTSPLQQKQTIPKQGAVQKDETPVQCLRCKQIVPKYSYMDHVKKHQAQLLHQQQYRLQQLAKNNGSSASNFVRPPRRLECPICKKVFGKSYNLKRHLQVHQKHGHGASGSSANSIHNPTSSNESSNEDESDCKMMNISPEVDLVKINSNLSSICKNNGSNNNAKEQSSISTLTPAILNRLASLSQLTVKKPAILININTNSSSLSPSSSTASQIQLQSKRPNASVAASQLQPQTVPKIKVRNDLKEALEGGLQISSVASVDHMYLDKLDKISAGLKGPATTITPTSSSVPTKVPAVPVIPNGSSQSQEMVAHGQKLIPLSSLQCPICKKMVSEPFSLKVHMR